MGSFVPVFVMRDIKTGDGGSVILQLCYLFLKSHLGYECRCPLLGGSGLVFVNLHRGQSFLCLNVIKGHMPKAVSFPQG